MKRAPLLALFSIAAACWVAAGPGGETLQALLACRHHAMHQTHPRHGGAPADGPCYCDEMTGGSDLVVSLAVPTPPIVNSVTAVPPEILVPQSPVPSPQSPFFTPATPPPITLG